MARQRISLVPEEVKEKATLESRIRSGQINPDNFYELTPEEQHKVNKLLFSMASEKVEPNIGTSVLEFILFSFIRLINKKVSGLALTQDEKEIEASLNQVLDMHQITNDKTAKSDWLFDYMEYAIANTSKILDTREKHINRKKEITGLP